MKDRITLKLTIEGDRLTLQYIRKLLQSDPVTLRQTLVETAGDYLKAEGVRAAGVSGELKSPSPNLKKPGRRKAAHPLPTCDGETLTIIDYDANNRTTVAAIDTDDYFFYVDTLKSFRYSCKKLSMTVIREKRGGSLVWYGHRRIEGKLKRKYLGKSSNLTAKRLYETAFELAQDDDLKRLFDEGQNE